MKNYKCKITCDQITYGPKTPSAEEAAKVAAELAELGYIKTSNAYCEVSRIDNDDWLGVLAAERKCSRAYFYLTDGSGVPDFHKHEYCVRHSKDRHTVAPEVIRLMAGR